MSERERETLRQQSYTASTHFAPPFLKAWTFCVLKPTAEARLWKLMMNVMRRLSDLLGKLPWSELRSTI